MPLRTQAWSAALLAGAILLLLAIAAGSGPAEIIRWYFSLQRPPWQPPDWLIPIVWGVIFALMAWALRRALRAAPDHAARRALIYATVANLFLNGLWAVLFFARRRPDHALIETVPLWLSVLLLLVLAARQDRVAGWLLAPYLVWVGFAAVLNLALVRLNAPFP